MKTNLFYHIFDYSICIVMLIFSLFVSVVQCDADPGSFDFVRENYTVTFPSKPKISEVELLGKPHTAESAELVGNRIDGIFRCEFAKLTESEKSIIKSDLSDILSDVAKADGLTDVSIVIEDANFGSKGVLRGSKIIRGRVATYQTIAYTDGRSVFSTLIASEAKSFPTVAGRDFIDSFRYTNKKSEGIRSSRYTGLETLSAFNKKLFKTLNTGDNIGISNKKARLFAPEGWVDLWGNSYYVDKDYVSAKSDSGRVVTALNKVVLKPVCFSVWTGIKGEFTEGKSSSATYKTLLSNPDGSRKQLSHLLYLETPQDSKNYKFMKDGIWDEVESLSKLLTAKFGKPEITLPNTPRKDAELDQTEPIIKIETAKSYIWEDSGRTINLCIFDLRVQFVAPVDQGLLSKDKMVDFFLRTTAYYIEIVRPEFSKEVKSQNERIKADKIRQDADKIRQDAAAEDF